MDDREEKQWKKEKLTNGEWGRKKRKGKGLESNLGWKLKKKRKVARMRPTKPKIRQTLLSLCLLGVSSHTSLSFFLTIFLIQFIFLSIFYPLLLKYYNIFTPLLVMAF